jgi:hypothetical protein
VSLDALAGFAAEGEERVVKRKFSLEIADGIGIGGVEQLCGVGGTGSEKVQDGGAGEIGAAHADQQEVVEAVAGCGGGFFDAF